MSAGGAGIAAAMDNQPALPAPGAVRLLGIDYHYCKGCLKCVDACPTGSLTELREQDGWAEAHRVPLFPQFEAARRAD